MHVIHRCLGAAGLRATKWYGRSSCKIRLRHVLDRESMYTPPALIYWGVWVV